MSPKTSQPSLMALDLNTIHHGDCLDLMAQLPAGSIDLTVTSPPYDGLRTYNGYSFDFEAVAAELYRVTKPGGVVVWVVGDATVKGSETGTSFRQALHFMSLGFNLYDTMFYEKASRIPTEGRYYNVVEYMFIFSKGKPSALNFIVDHKNATEGLRRTKDKVINKGVTQKKIGEWMVSPEFSRRSNVWRYGTCRPSDLNGLLKETGQSHPAIFPEKLAADHILSWSNPGDIVLDPFAGSGTTAKMAVVNNRNYIGCEVSAEYVAIARARLAALQTTKANQYNLFPALTLNQ